MDGQFAEVRQYLTESVRTRRTEFEAYMTELAELNGRAVPGEIDRPTYRQQHAAIEQRYEGRIHRDDCRTYATVAEYRQFLELIKRADPATPLPWTGRLSMNSSTHRHLRTWKGSPPRYGFWLLREDDGTVSGCPCIVANADRAHCIEARRRSVGAPDELSPHDRLELGLEFE